MGDNIKDLAGIVGQKNVLYDPETLKAYSADQSFALSMTPSIAVRPSDAHEVEEIVTNGASLT